MKYDAITGAAHIAASSTSIQRPLFHDPDFCSRYWARALLTADGDGRGVCIDKTGPLFDWHRATVRAMQLISENDTRHSCVTRVLASCYLASRVTGTVFLGRHFRSPPCRIQAKPEGGGGHAPPLEHVAIVR